MPIFLITIDRSRWSRCSDLADHDGPTRALDPAYPGHPDTRWACGSGAKSRFRTTLGRSASSDSGD